MSFYQDLRMLLPKLSIFIFQGLLKLSEGEETISAGEHKRWNRSRPKIKSVPISYGLCFFPQKYMCALHIYTFIFAASFSEGFLAQNTKNFSNALQSNPAALVMNAGQRWHCSQPGVSFSHASFVVLSYMNPTWQRGVQLDQLTTVFTGMGVQGRSRYFLIYFDNLQRMIGISVSTLQLPAIRATFQSFSVVEVDVVNFHFAFFAGLALPRVKKGVLNDA